MLAAAHHQPGGTLVPLWPSTPRRLSILLVPVRDKTGVRWWGCGCGSLLWSGAAEERGWPRGRDLGSRITVNLPEISATLVCVMLINSNILITNYDIK